MKVYVDRFKKLMQITTGRDVRKYKKVRVQIGRGSWEHSTLLYESEPVQTFIFPFNYSVMQIADVFLVGVKPRNKTEIITQAPLRQNANQGNPLFDKELYKQQLDQTKRLRLAEDVILYLKQQETDSVKCSCISKGYNKPDLDCELCGGTGIEIDKGVSYIGINQKVMVPGEENVQFDPGEKGNIIYRERRGAWTNGFPALSNLDLLERLNGERYYITVTGTRDFDGVILNQTFDLKSVEDYSPLNVAMLEGSTIQLKKKLQK